MTSKKMENKQKKIPRFITFDDDRSVVERDDRHDIVYNLEDSTYLIQPLTALKQRQPHIILAPNILTWRWKGTQETISR